MGAIKRWLIQWLLGDVLKSVIAWVMIKLKGNKTYLSLIGFLLWQIVRILQGTSYSFAGDWLQIVLQILLDAGADPTMVSQGLLGGVLVGLFDKIRTWIFGDNQTIEDKEDKADAQI